MEEFLSLPHTLGPELALKVPEDCQIARANPTKNRYENVLPFDQNVYRHPSDQDFYINASHLELDTEHPNYIITQGPLPHTRADFWEMVMLSGSQLIVNVTPFEEKGFVKCSKYYPDEKGESVKYGKYTVRTVAKQELCSTAGGSSNPQKLTLRHIDVLHKNGINHRVRHLQYENWPDMGVPNIQVLAHLVDNIHIIQKEIEANNTESETTIPIIIHCSAGIGRTGVTVALHHVLERHHRRRGTPNLEEVVGRMREPHRGRVGMIQTPQQYKFVKTLVAALDADPDAESLLKAVQQYSR